MNMFFGNKKDKIFCISFQRTGTTSVGDFFEQNGFARAGWNETKKNQWGLKYFFGNYEGIFNSKDFKRNKVFEDGPWSLHCGHFYKVLFHRFPNARFVLFTRDPDNWYRSMMSHSHKKTLGNTFRHCHYYEREKEFYDTFGTKTDVFLDKIKPLPLTDEYRDHYVNIYETRNAHAVNFFKKHHSNSNRFIHCELEDEKKWEKLAGFFNLSSNNQTDIHSNKSQ